MALPVIPCHWLTISVNSDGAVALVQPGRGLAEGWTHADGALRPHGKGMSVHSVWGWGFDAKGLRGPHSAYCLKPQRCSKRSDCTVYVYSPLTAHIFLWNPNHHHHQRQNRMQSHCQTGYRANYYTNFSRRTNAAALGGTFKISAKKMTHWPAAQRSLVTGMVPDKGSQWTVSWYRDLVWRYCVVCFVALFGVYITDKG